MTDPEIIALCLIFDGLLILFWVLVRLDLRSKEERYRDKLDAARNRLRP